MGKAKQSRDIRSTTKKHSDAQSVESIGDDDYASNGIGLPRWLETLAIFGDSTIALSFSFFLVILSAAISFYLDNGTLNPSFSWEYFIGNKDAKNLEAAYRKLGPIPDWVETSVPVLQWNDDVMFQKELKRLFDRDGVVAVRGLLEPSQVDLLDEASNLLIQQQYEKKRAKPRGPLTGKPAQNGGTQFFTVKQGAIFLGLNSTAPESQVDNSKDKAFLQVALQSKIPQVIAETLLQLEPGETLRLMRDIFLAKDADEYVCGWHVDDTGFWPATAEAPGVNAWIALDDMPVEGGGGFALAVGSHTADWRHEAYSATGSTHTFPPEGFISAKDMLERRVGNGTCNIAQAAPHLHRRMEETKRIYNMKRGDVILHTRWLFHRTVPFHRAIVEDRQPEDPPLLYRRYSIRYGPGSSIIPKGYGTELSVLWDEQNGGRTADQVAAEDAPWYPQAWPSALDDSERQKLEEIVAERLVQVTRLADTRRQQMRRVRQTAALHREPH